MKALRSALALPILLALSLSLSCLTACTGAALVQQGPSDTLRAYAQALEQERVDEAYRLLSDEAKRSMSLEAFRRAVQENPEDAVEIARAIARPSSDPVVTATVTVPSFFTTLGSVMVASTRILAAHFEHRSASKPSLDPRFTLCSLTKRARDQNA